MNMATPGVPAKAVAPERLAPEPAALGPEPTTLRPETTALGPEPASPSPEPAALGKINFRPDGLVPVVVQDAASGEVLMLAYADGEALRRTLAEGKAWFYSRARRRLWLKGESSGNFQRVVEVRYDCDGDALLYRVLPQGPACHTGQRSCFYRGWQVAPSVSTLERLTEEERAAREQAHPGIIMELYALLRQRLRELPAGSYTADLFRQGPDRLLQKVGEEAVEVILAGKGSDRSRLIGEVADLCFHLLAFLAYTEVSPGEIWAELARRRAVTPERATPRAER